MRRWPTRLGLLLHTAIPRPRASRFCSHSTVDGGREAGGSGGGTPSLVLSPSSVALRRFLRERQKSSPRWWESPGHVDALITLLLDNCERGELHPFLAAEVVKRLGYAVGPEGGRWAARCGHSAGSVNRVTECLLIPLIPLVRTHPVVQPLLPVVVEWMLSVSNMPKEMTFTHVSLYVDKLSRMSAEELVRHEWPSFDFLLHSFASRYSYVREGILYREVEDIIYKMLKLFSLQDVWRPSGQKVSQGSLPTETIVESNMMVECLFWKGEFPLLVHSVVCSAYRRIEIDRCDIGQHGENRQAKSKPVLRVLVTDDDMLRRALLRLLASHSSAPKKSDVLVDDALLTSSVCVDLCLKLDDPSVILRFIVPLSEFVEQIVTSGVRPALPLSFRSVQEIIYNAVGELRRAQNQPARPQYALLLHKPRIHALKNLCGRLLTETQQLVCEEQKLAHELGDEFITFPGAPLKQQLHTLQSFHRAASHLVRAVMNEKAASLAEEGSEGSVLHAGGSSTSRDSVAASLRNVAFRVLEVSLLRYYSALEKNLCYPNNYRVTPDSSEVAAALAEVEHHAGGKALLFTARHILRCPLRQDVTAVVEGLRLVAIQGLLLRSEECVSWLRGEGYSNFVANAFFGIWHRSSLGKANLRNPPTDAGVSDAEPLEFQQRMCNQLLWTLLLLHHRYCPCCTGAAQEPNAKWLSVTYCSLLTSLLDLLASGPVPNEFAAFGWCCPNFACAEQAPLTGRVPGIGGELWEKHIVYPPSGNAVSDEAARWDLLDELSPVDGTNTWLWLGTSMSVREASATVGSSDDVATHCTGYLLPWSTVAKSRHPLRFYDESGQSATAALSFDAAVEAILQRKGAHVPLRLISVREEAMFFREMEHTAKLSLSPKVLVIHPWAQSERCVSVTDASVVESFENIFDGDCDFLD
uniref:Uncharacterized protein n=1 Tax=Trypanosoma congolense (strain IL3000) TaxID=1068625 RepID=G0UY55_TRYCI|nr:conserved hypothetical protein [Trypanosoma congolense IL3000]